MDLPQYNSTTLVLCSFGHCYWSTLPFSEAGWRKQLPLRLVERPAAEHRLQAQSFRV